MKGSVELVMSLQPEIRKGWFLPFCSTVGCHWLQLVFDIYLLAGFFCNERVRSVAVILVRTFDASTGDIPVALVFF